MVKRPFAILILCGLAALFLTGGCATKPARVYEGTEEVRANAVKTALSQMGKPYRLGARGPDAFDCSGLVFYAYNRYGIRLPQTAETMNQAGYGVDAGAVLPGDLVFFLVNREYHVGMMINRRDFVHASKSKGVAIDSVETAYWRRNLSGFRSIF
jgi:cell wall-associated NlpC family hydrolase